MLSFLLESAARSLALGIIVWAALRLFRVRTPQDRSLVWTAVLLTAVTMPLLMKTIESMLASVPSAATEWIPAGASPLFLRPLSAGSSPATNPAVDWMVWATVIYVLIGATLLLRMLAGLLQSRRLVRMAVPINEPWTHGWDIRTSKHLTIPVTYGSTILFPSDWPHWNSFTRDAVLLHEQAHVRRRDFYVHLLARLHRAVFWFSPMAWWLPSQLLELAEVASDDAALGKVQDRVLYAEILVDVARK